VISGKERKGRKRGKDSPASFHQACESSLGGGKSRSLLRGSGLLSSMSCGLLAMISARRRFRRAARFGSSTERMRARKRA
jgi:hypothetical protein